MKRVAACFAAGILALAGCSGGTDSEGGTARLLGDVRDTFRANREARQNPPGPPQVTRAELDGLTVAILEVNIEARDITALLVPAAVRDARGSGDITVWTTVDNSHVVLQDGVLYATRGLGRDMASADASPAMRAVSARGPATGAREMQIRDDDFSAYDLRFSCAVRVVGDTAITIVEKQHSVRHLKERCENESGFFENDYWVDAARDVVQSRQWAGPGIGFVNIRLLRK